MTIVKSNIFQRLLKQLFYPLKSKPKANIFSKASKVKIDITIASITNNAYAILPEGSNKGLSKIKLMVEIVINMRMKYSNPFA